MNKKKEKILVGLSGGVDSAVCVLLLRQQGFDVHGVHFVMDGRTDASSNAKKVANQLGVPLVVKDVSRDFQKKVVDHFIREYKNNRTPNPCVVCNPKLKFSKLLQAADEMGIEKVATGHYACLLREGDRFVLKKAKDKKKDQSYFLHRLGQGQLKRAIFPLCGTTKEKIKEVAKRNKVIIQEKESQDVCFFAKDESLKIFFGQRHKEKEGEIVDEHGNVLGKHEGAIFFTIGQRHGLNLGGNGPFYVLRKDPQKNEIVVTNDKDHKKLWSDKIEIEKSSWVSGEPEKDKIYEIKTRYQVLLSKGSLAKKEKGGWVARLEKPQWAVAPGQSLVVCSGDEVIGGGFIKEAI